MKRGEKKKKKGKKRRSVISTTYSSEKKEKGARDSSPDHPLEREFKGRCFASVVGRRGKEEPSHFSGGKEREGRGVTHESLLEDNYARPGGRKGKKKKKRNSFSFKEGGRSRRIECPPLPRRKGRCATKKKKKSPSSEGERIDTRMPVLISRNDPAAQGGKRKKKKKRRKDVLIYTRSYS